MAKRTPNITTPDGRTMTVARIHPARFSDAHVELFSRLLEHEAVLLGRPVRALDPMCGVGNVHRCASANVDTVGNEIERPFVHVARQLWPDRQTVQGDAGALGFESHSFDAVVVSPDFGNRLGDVHRANDPCRCRKSKVDGVLVVAPVADPRCGTCSGSGISLRRSYYHDLVRLTGDVDYRLTDGSSAGSYAWQAAYWTRQAAYWAEALRVLRPGGLMVLDAKDGVRTVKGQRRVVPVVAGHRKILESLGFDIEADVPLACDGLRFGENRELRVDGHAILIARRPAVAGEVAA